MLFFATLSMAKQPHSVVMVLDDLGWADVSFHGSEFPTPNIDSLAKSGVTFNRYYVQPVCSPTRSAIMSGRWPFRTGMQHFMTVAPASDAHLPTDAKTIAELLQDQGYSTHMLGKWHLGSSKWEYTPTGRGFDSFTGYHQGAIDYYSKNFSLSLIGLPGYFSGLDFWQNRTAWWGTNDSYSMELYQDAALRILDNYNSTAADAKPLFFYYAHQNIHEPLQLPKPDRGASTACAHVTETKDRNILCQMMFALDSAIGEFVDVLKKKKMWEDTIMWVTTDNGGMVAYQEGGVASASSNYPFRAGKVSLYEGGVRGVSFVTGGDNVLPTKARGAVRNDLMHAVDILPTLIPLARSPTIPAPDLSGVDGLDMWETIANGKPGSRVELPLNINPHCLFCKLGSLTNVHPNLTAPLVTNFSAIISGDWKLVFGDAGPFYDGWWSSDNYTWTPAASSEANTTIHLFNLAEDESEHHNLAAYHPEIVNTLLQRIAFYADPENGFKKPQFMFPSPKGFPINHNGTWAPFEE